MTSVNVKSSNFPALISFNSLKTVLGALINCAVCCVRAKVLVHTVRSEMPEKYFS